MFKFLGIIFLILLVFAAICYSQGWVQLNRGGDSSSVEIKTDEIKKAAEGALDSGKKMVKTSAGKIEDFADGDVAESVEKSGAVDFENQNP